MATELETLQAIKTNILARIQEYTDKLRPDQSIDGESYSWRNKLKEQFDALDKINEQIAQANGEMEIEQIGESPW